MNPHLLTLALTTPLEQLLELPNAVRIAACAREDLQRFSAEQLAQMLASIDAAISDTVTLAQIKHGGELVNRREQRDLDWFIEVTNQAEWPRLRSATATDRDYLRLLALHKLGAVIEATTDTPPGIIIRPAVEALMESLESLVLAHLLPESPSTEQIIEEAWKAGLTPEPVAADEVRKAVQATRYPPHGFRGTGGVTRATLYGRIPNYFHRAAEQICTIIQVESPAAVKAIPEMCKVEGLDAIFIGPNDLAANSGHLGDMYHADVQAMCNDALKAIKAGGKAAGILTFNVELAKKQFALGFDFIAVGGDAGLLARGAEALAKQFDGR